MSLPLAGLTILVTRPAHQAAGLAEPLEALGATVYSLPAIAIEPPEDLEALDAVLYDWDRFDWVIFTSVNGVNAVRDRMDALGLNRKAQGRTEIAAVGPSTAQAVRDAFREPAAMPEKYVSDEIADALGDVRGKWVLLPRADIARREVVDRLNALGALTEEVVAYRIVRPTDDAPLPEQVPDVITLTSSSSVHGTRDALAARGKESWMRESRLACIGPITAATARDLGYEVALMAEEHSIPGLVDAIVASRSLPLGGGQGGGLLHA
ncbi:uroporphyrinogen-III synthase [bacterium]|nr:MAG: uroporphyrinogen-III synthase [bacterium]